MLPWHVWRDGILPFAPPLHSRLICRRFEVESRKHLTWKVPPLVYDDSPRKRVMCAQRLLYKNPKYAYIGGEHCETFLFHFVCTRLEQTPGMLEDLESLVVVHSFDIFRLVAMIRRCSSLRTLAWLSIDEQDEIPWETLQSVLSNLTCFTSPLVDPVAFMGKLQVLRVVDEPGIRELRALHRRLPRDNVLQAIMFGNPHVVDIDMRHHVKAGRLITQIIDKCEHLKMVSITTLGVSLDTIKPKRKQKVHLQVVARVIAIT